MAVRRHTIVWSNTLFDRNKVFVSILLVIHARLLIGTCIAIPTPSARPVRISTDPGICAARWGQQYTLGEHVLLHNSTMITVVDTEPPRLHCGGVSAVPWLKLPCTVNPSATDNCGIVFCKAMGPFGACLLHDDDNE